MTSAAALCDYLPANRRRCLKTVIRIVGSKEEAEDVVQEASLKALVTRSPFRGDSAFSSWFHKVLVNSSLMRLRAENGPRRGGDRGRVELTDQIGICEVTPYTLLADEERAQLLLDAVGEVSPLSREALLAHYYLGMTMVEIALAAKVTESVIKSRLLHGRQQLRALLRHEREQLIH